MFFKLLKKELKSLLTFSLFIMIIFYFGFFYFMGAGIEGAKESAKKLATEGIKIAVVVDTPENRVYEEIKNVSHVIETKNEKEAVEIAKKENLPAILVINGEKVRIIWMVRGLGITDNVPMNAVRDLLNMVKEKLKEDYLRNKGINKAYLDQIMETSEEVFVRSEKLKISFETFANMMMNYVTLQPMMIAFIVSFAGSILVTSIAMEREMKTLETLLTLPVKRIHIAFSKLVAASITGIILGGSYMLGFSMYMKRISEAGKTVENSIQLFSNYDITLMGFSLILALYSGLALCLLVGLLSRDIKTASTLSFPVSMLGFVPAVIGMFKDFTTMNPLLKALLFIIPFTHPVYAPRMLLFKDYKFVWSGIFYNILLGTVLTIAVKKIFESDIIINGVKNQLHKLKSINK